MAFKNGSFQVGSVTPTKIYDPVATGFVVLQNIGTTVCYAGGPGVTASGANQGVQLNVGSGAGVGGLPVSFPIAHYGELADQDDAIYAISAAGTATVAFVANT